MTRRTQTRLWRELLACGALCVAACDPFTTAGPAGAGQAAQVAALPSSLDWRVGSRYHYGLTSSGVATMSSGGTVMDIKLSAELQVTPLRAQGPDVELQLHFEPAQATSGQAGAEPELQLLARQLVRPALARYAHGELVELRLPPDSSRFTEAVTRSVAAALQFRSGTGSTWEATENDGTGRYVARYQVLSGAGQLTKTKLRYEQLTVTTPDDPRGRGTLQARVNQSSGRIGVRGGVLASLQQDDSLAIALGPTSELMSRSTLELTLLREAPVAGAGNAETLRAQTEVRHTLQVARGQEPSAALDQAHIAGRNFDQALVALESDAKAQSPGPMRSRNGEPLGADEIEAREQALAESSSAFQVMASLLRRQPEQLAPALQAIRSGSVAQRKLIWALASAGTPAAQAGLVDLATDTSLALDLRKTVAFGLSRVPRPAPETVAAFERWRRERPLRIIAIYGLGTFARRLREGGDSDAARLGALLRQELGRAGNVADRVDVLHALFNAADTESRAVLEAELGHASPMVRRAATLALGRIAGPAIDTVLARVIALDSDWHVRSAALEVAAERAHSPELAQVVDQAARADVDTRCRSHAVVALGRWLPEHPELRASVEHVATSDAQEQVRSAARRFLGSST